MDSGIIKQETQLLLRSRATHLYNDVTDPTAPLKHVPPHMCYHAEFGRSRSNHGCMSSEEPQTFGSAGARLLGWTTWLT